jgi:hypothetical protein
VLAGASGCNARPGITRQQTLLCLLKVRDEDFRVVR